MVRYFPALQEERTLQFHKSVLWNEIFSHKQHQLPKLVDLVLNQKLKIALFWINCERNLETLKKSNKSFSEQTPFWNYGYQSHSKTSQLRWLVGYLFDWLDFQWGHKRPWQSRVGFRGGPKGPWPPFSPGNLFAKQQLNSVLEGCPKCRYGLNSVYWNYSLIPNDSDS